MGMICARSTLHLLVCLLSHLLVDCLISQRNRPTALSSSLFRLIMNAKLLVFCFVCAVCFSANLKSPVFMASSLLFVFQSYP